MGKESTLTAEQRSQLVLRLLSKEESAAQIARRDGITEQMLYRWREEFLAAGKRAMNGSGGQSEQANALERLRADLGDRDQVIAELTIANRVLNSSGLLS